MRAMWVAVAAVVCWDAVAGFAQNSPPIALPQIARTEDSALGGGTNVSRPLTPVEIPPAVPPENAPEPTADPVQRIEEVHEQKFERRGPLGPSWDNMELLLWWPKAHALPPLVTGSRTGMPPILGSPGTTLLVGNHALANQDIDGGRFTLGSALNEDQTFGAELVYFFLGSRTLHETIRNGSNLPAVGLPFINATTGREDVFSFAAPGISSGSVFVTTTTRVQGAEANFVSNLIDSKLLRLNGLVGYRFLQVQEGLTLQQMRVQFGSPGSFGPIYDQFDGHNRFNGGQLGLHADIAGQFLFCELTAKCALGQSFEVVKVDGATTVYTPVLGGLSMQHSPGGVFALPTNIGRTTHSAFAVVPEGICKFGIKLGDSGRFFVGYNFLYLSDAVRPGDQVDRTLNPTQIAALNPGGSLVGIDRPRGLFNRSDFWVQGLMLGLETRY